MVQLKPNVVGKRSSRILRMWIRVNFTEGKWSHPFIHIFFFVKLTKRRIEIFVLNYLLINLMITAVVSFDIVLWSFEVEYKSSLWCQILIWTELEGTVKLVSKDTEKRLCFSNYYQAGKSSLQSRRILRQWRLLWFGIKETSIELSIDLSIMYPLRPITFVECNVIKKCSSLHW